ncbi:DNA-binding NtrC family response regulator [Flavobacterium sp. 7E]|uniref:sigma-54-dependent transcriptional regulator n=1 Tax=Flavobacterium sp. 7E TaxID=2735898 RepID=UPI0015709B4B|nr:sigma-54 dependent transcriptional regulator [Flavobacterium sp. 7E]NRS87809.1 DNA-binding NtrC family response regulator [Flavobacterium sp. 7E]
MKNRILIVEDEFIVANDLSIILSKAGYEVCGTASSVIDARKLITATQPDWVVLDIILKGELSGIDLAWELLELKIPFIYLSANTNQSTLREANATQPFGFLVKPFREKDLLVMLNIAQYKNEINEIYKTNQEMPLTTNRIEGIIGKSPKLQAVLSKIEIVAPTDTSVLIIGESGTGKEKIAKTIHKQSQQKNAPLIIINCAALPATLIESELFGYEKGAFTGANSMRKGKFEQAEGGTIFLDEIGELPLESQVKILRVLQEKEIERLGGNQTIKINVRIIAATNRCLEKEVAEGRFRLDLFYRLNVFPIEIPALRNRKEDIEDLAYHFIRKYTTNPAKKNIEISKMGIRQLLAYHWPGNIRELEHLIERTLLLNDKYIIESFEINIPQTIQQNSPQDSSLLSMEEMERTHVMQALKLSNGKVFGTGGAAELLKISPSTLYSKIKKLGIQHGYQ